MKHLYIQSTCEKVVQGQGNWSHRSTHFNLFKGNCLCPWQPVVFAGMCSIKCTVGSEKDWLHSGNKRNRQGSNDERKEPQVSVYF